MVAGKRVLLIAYAFPPVASPESWLSAKTMTAIPDTKVDVITCMPWKGQVEDHSMDSYVAEKFGVVRRLKPSWWMQNRLLRRFKLFSACPDIYRFMACSVVREAEKLGIHNYDAVVTWSQWHSAHLAGLALKRRHPNIRWVAHFSDPWVDNPYVSYGGLLKKVNSRLEASVIETVDCAVFTNSVSRNLIMGKYPPFWRKKAAVVPHPYDQELYPIVDKGAGDGKMVFRYIGGFYGPRSPEPLYKALFRLHEQDENALKNVQFELIGPIAPEHQESLLLTMLPEGLVSFVDPVGYRESLALMREADALLIIDAPAATSVFLPSKLIDYAGADKPVYGITPKGVSNDVIASFGGVSADPEDIDGVAEMLKNAISEIRAQSGHVTFEEDARAQYEASIVGASMRRIVFNESSHN